MSVTNPIAIGQVLPLRIASPAAAERGLILIIADDDLAEPIRLELESSGFAVHVATSRSEGLQACRSRDVAAIVLDRMGGGTDGLPIVEELRSTGDHTPLLVVGVPDSVEERITYIRSGADDYLTRPFDLREMTARVEALLRRRRDERVAVLEVGAIEMDLVKRVVRCMGRRVDLLPREFTLLEYFARHPRQILSREKLLEDVWRSRAYGRTNVVDVQVGNLRRKLDPTGERRFIVSVRGAGFRLEPAGLD